MFHFLPLPHLHSYSVMLLFFEIGGVLIIPHTNRILKRHILFHFQLLYVMLYLVSKLTYRQFIFE
ncbi:hypothetical protein EV421DRAFT_1853088, partial [Armillaria borealis]